MRQLAGWQPVIAVMVTLSYAGAGTTS